MEAFGGGALLHLLPVGVQPIVFRSSRVPKTSEWANLGQFSTLFQGFLTLIPWTELPKSDEVDPNESLYRLGHSLAHNDCLMRAKGKFIALVDVDEIIVPSNRYNINHFIHLFRNQSLSQLLHDLLKTHPLSGSFLFKHARLGFPTSRIKPNSDLRLLDFHWLLSAMAYIGNGPSKVVFVPDRTDITLTHRVRKHKEPYSEVEVGSSH